MTSTNDTTGTSTGHIVEMVIVPEEIQPIKRMETVPIGKSPFDANRCSDGNAQGGRCDELILERADHSVEDIVTVMGSLDQEASYQASLHLDGNRNVSREDIEDSLENLTIAPNALKLSHCAEAMDAKRATKKLQISGRKSPTSHYHIRDCQRRVDTVQSSTCPDSGHCSSDDAERSELQPDQSEDHLLDKRNHVTERTNQLIFQEDTTDESLTRSYDTTGLESAAACMKDIETVAMLDSAFTEESARKGTSYHQPSQKQRQRCPPMKDIPARFRRLLDGENLNRLNGLNRRLHYEGIPLVKWTQPDRQQIINGVTREEAVAQQEGIQGGDGKGGGVLSTQAGAGNFVEAQASLNETQWLTRAPMPQVYQRSVGNGTFQASPGHLSQFHHQSILINGTFPIADNIATTNKIGPSTDQATSSFYHAGAIDTNSTIDWQDRYSGAFSNAQHLYHQGSPGDLQLSLDHCRIGPTLIHSNCQTTTLSPTAESGGYCQSMESPIELGPCLAQPSQLAVSPLTPFPQTPFPQSQPLLLLSPLTHALPPMITYITVPQSSLESQIIALNKIMYFR